MKALVVNKQGALASNELVIIEKEIPVPEEGEVLVRVNACGICHTDLHVIEGDLPHVKMPLTPGHQIVGIVEHTGHGVTELQEGDRVGVAWLHRACGVCCYCKRGMENLCEKPLFTGYMVDGGFAEYCISDARYTYKIPAGFTDIQAAPLLCAGIIGYRSYKLSRINPGENLGLYGFGAAAHIVIQIARYFKCNVYVFTRSEEHRELAKKLGAVWVGSTEVLPPEPLDSAIIFAPAGSLYINALKAVRRGGIVASAGIHMSPIPQFPYELLYHERIMLSVANNTRTDAHELLELAASIPINTYVNCFSFNDTYNALLLLKKGQINGAGVIVVGG